MRLFDRTRMSLGAGSWIAGGSLAFEGLHFGGNQQFVSVRSWQGAAASPLSNAAAEACDEDHLGSGARAGEELASDYGLWARAFAGPYSHSASKEPLFHGGANWQ